jgi:hypothetical protein
LIGWGAQLLAAEEEARRRGCNRVCVSSFTFQAPGFYRKYGYVELDERWAFRAAVKTSTCSSSSRASRETREVSVTST